MSLLILVLLAGAAALALHNPRHGLVATLATGVLMLLLWRGQMPVWSGLWLPWLLLLLWCVKPIRLLLVTLPLMQLIKRKLPPLSDTEREAIAAGSTWWEGDLFRAGPTGKTAGAAARETQPGGTGLSRRPRSPTAHREAETAKAHRG